MILKNIRVFFYLGLVLLALASCSKFKKIQKSTNMETKYQAAVSYYQSKDYFRALQLFEELVTIYRGSEKGELSLYYFAKCHYNTKDYISAAYYFENFTKTYGTSIYAEECAYLVAYCNYLDSPINSLDQSNTMESLKQFQLFANRYPKSQYIAECNTIMDELRLKLETKAFKNARLYYQIEDYKAAIISLNNVVKDYPYSAYKEECLFLILKSSYIYAHKSIETKQSERFKVAIDNYHAYKENFEHGKFMDEANKIANKITDEIKIVSLKK
nr:outer membrane protein assembly factor BamD [Bacteroidota bacterium]